MKNDSPARNPRFVRREPYWQRLAEIDAEEAAALIVVYGRRRVGKTELIEQFFRGRPLLKFEGLQPDREGVHRGSPAERRCQMAECVKRLGLYCEKPAEYEKKVVESWSDFFRLLQPLLADKAVVLYLDEVQWMANYSDEMLAELKPFWDDVLRHNPRLRIVLSGSSIVNQFLSSSALCARSNHMIKLEPFNLQETAQLLGKGAREAMLAAIAVGGVPEYLKQVRKGGSVFISLCEESFRPDGFFRAEKDRMLASSLAASRSHERIIGHLARKGPSSRADLYKALSREHKGSAGGSFSQVLDELVELDLVERILPVTKAGAIRDPSRSRHARYVLADEHLRFYYMFIDPRMSNIDAGKYAENPTAAINRLEFRQAMGLSFERWCCRNEQLIARHLRFGGVVEYAHGPWYKPGSTQIDLMFIRKDRKIIICEIKYNRDTRLRREVILDAQEKVDVFLENNPRYARHTIETALITIEPVPASLKNEAYFTYLITSDQLLATAARDN